MLDSDLQTLVWTSIFDMEHLYTEYGAEILAPNLEKDSYDLNRPSEELFANVKSVHPISMNHYAQTLSTASLHK